MPAEVTRASRFGLALVLVVSLGCGRALEKRTRDGSADGAGGLPIGTVGSAGSVGTGGDDGTGAGATTGTGASTGTGAAGTGGDCPAGTVCRAVICGDGVLESAREACDDGNTTPGDGCAADCATVLTGWRCPVPGRGCVPICGDGILVGSEGCDDGNAAAGDGCSRDCMPEPGCTCEGAICTCSPCTPGQPAPGLSCDVPTCGDGIVSGAEECDLGAANADGVYGGCTSACRWGPRCGDAIVDAGHEHCDYGDRVNGSAGSACLRTCFLLI